MFGVQEAKVTKRNKFSLIITDTKSAITQGLNGDTLTGALFAESLKPVPDAGHKAHVLAAFEDGTPAITSTPYGKGEALYIGSFLGLARQRFPHSIKNDDHLLHNLLQWAEVKLPFTTPGVNGEDVEVRLHKNRDTGDYLLFVINHEKKKQSVSIQLNQDNLGLQRGKKIKLKELIDGSEMGLSGRHLKLQAELPAKGVKVWYIEQ
jgi:beta-galactosidase